MFRSEPISTLFAALHAAQNEFPPVLKEADNPFYKSKYADLSTCLETVTPTLRKHGLSVIQFPHSDTTGVGVETIIFHTSGEYIGKEFSLPVTEAKIAVQQGAAAVTYARRVALLAALGIAAEDDDDGETASGRGKVPKKEKASTKSAKASSPDGPPKAEIPAELPSGGSALPTAEERQGFYNRLTTLAEEAKGLTPPIKTKVVKYLYKVTGLNNMESIPSNKWNAFFKIVDAVKAQENGIEKLVALINDAQ